jgi:hypothetical protein
MDRKTLVGRHRRQSSFTFYLLHSAETRWEYLHFFPHLQLLKGTSRFTHLIFYVHIMQIPMPFLNHTIELLTCVR